MKTNDLLTIWSAPDPPRLTPKQLSIRVPMLVSAKISALLDLYPKKTKTDIIGDLLITALEMLEKELPMYKESRDPDGFESDGEAYFGYCGIRKDYFQITEKYLRKMEKEAHIKEPMTFSYPSAYMEDDFKWE
jgi:hypothetical protein